MSAESIYRRFMARFADNLRKQGDDTKRAAKALHVAKTYGSDVTMAFAIEGQYFEITIPGGSPESSEFLESMCNWLVGFGHHLAFAADMAQNSGNGGDSFPGPENAREAP